MSRPTARLLALGTVLALLWPGAAAALEYQGAGRGTPRPAYPGGGGIAAAARFLDGRAGRTAFAVVDDKGRLSGLRLHLRFNSASVVKAMLLVAYLERLADAGRGLDPASRSLLYPMIHVSDNNAASAVFGIVGDAGLRRVAGQVGMTDFATSGRWWGFTQISAADQARFFVVQDHLIPPQFDGYARGLLSGISADQSWGVPAVGRPRFRVFFKGGWLPSEGLVNQAARLEGRGATFAIAVLTTGGPSMGYGEQTIEGVAARVLGNGA
ncbi:MAG: serine hydrolase [Solirubrobacteraceae bacterium]